MGLACFGSSGVCRGIQGYVAAADEGGCPCAVEAEVVPGMDLNAVWMIGYLSICLSSALVVRVGMEAYEVLPAYVI